MVNPNDISNALFFRTYINEDINPIELQNIIKKYIIESNNNASLEFNNDKNVAYIKSIRTINP